MGRPTELKTRVARNVIFENDELKEFEEIVGKDNVSKEIRALMHNFLVEQKKGYALTDPLNLARHKPIEVSTNNNNTTLDIYLLSRNEIIKYIDTIDDVERLADIANKGKVFQTVAYTRKKNLLPYQKLLNEMKNKK